MREADYTRPVFDGVPVPGTTKAKLIQGALAEFGTRPYVTVGVTELAELAGVTIGSLYHHFGSKLGIYNAVRGDVERRLLDRMEGAAAARPGEVAAVLLVGYDYLAGAGFARLLAEPHPERDADPIEGFVSTLADRDDLPIGRILLAAWRAALGAVADGHDAGAVRGALQKCLGGA
jgi:AcrR family transcriptional regulator